MTGFLCSMSRVIVPGHQTFKRLPTGSPSNNQPAYPTSDRAPESTNTNQSHTSNSTLIQFPLVQSVANHNSGSSNSVSLLAGSTSTISTILTVSSGADSSHQQQLSNQSGNFSHTTSHLLPSSVQAITPIYHSSCTSSISPNRLPNYFRMVPCLPFGELISL